MSKMTYDVLGITEERSLELFDAWVAAVTVGEDGLTAIMRLAETKEEVAYLAYGYGKATA